MAALHPPAALLPPAGTPITHRSRCLRFSTPRSETHRTFWFNPSTLESEIEYALVGAVLGLAIYNGERIALLRLPSCAWQGAKKHGLSAPACSSSHSFSAGKAQGSHLPKCHACTFPSAPGNCVTQVCLSSTPSAPYKTPAGQVLDVHFPLVVYKKLLGQRPGFADLQAAFPELGRGLQQLLDFEGDVEAVFCRT